jgi:hypothetical protein
VADIPRDFGCLYRLFSKRRQRQLAAFFVSAASRSGDSVIVTGAPPREGGR